MTGTLPIISKLMLTNLTVCYEAQYLSGDTGTTVQWRESKMGGWHACTVVFMPGETTSMACGEKGRLSRNLVVVAPAGKSVFSGENTWPLFHRTPRCGVSGPCMAQPLSNLRTHTQHAAAPDEQHNMHRCSLPA